MAEDDRESRTEEPTEKRIGDTRKKGRVAKSIEVNTVLVLLTATVFFTYAGMYTLEGTLRIFREMFMISGEYQFTPASAQFLLAQVLYYMFAVILPFMVAMALVGVLANVWQNDGWIFSWEPLSPKFNKINPLTGWSRFLGKEGAANLVKSLGKLALIGTAVWYSIEGELDLIPLLLEANMAQALLILGKESLELFLLVLLTLVIIAAADFAYQKWQYKDQLKMTKQEVRDERKQMDGDPLIKQRIRQKQFEFFRRRMMAQVPKAEVIITNPTHLSIALRYDRMRDPAPMVVAKGAGHVAMKIREIAREHNIPIIEDKPLARTLFKSVDIGEQIPETLYKAVAETLAYVYRLKRKVL